MLQRKEIGWQKVGCVGGLLGLRIVMIFSAFQIFGILLLLSEMLKILVTALMACGPKCLG